MDAACCLSCRAGATKAWGEVSPASGGVIIPYLGTIDLRGILPGQGVSFGYSDCLKWGYQGSLTVVYFNVTQAVGILGLDLTRVREASHVWGGGGGRGLAAGLLGRAAAPEGGLQPHGIPSIIWASFSLMQGGPEWHV